ncbi:WD repeat-containing protein 5, partial [Durusdinium trenchii]
APSLAQSERQLWSSRATQPNMAGGYSGGAMAIEGAEEVTSIGTGTKRIRSKYTVNPGYAPVADCFCVRFSPDDQYLATSFANGAIHVYSADTGRQEFLLNGSPPSLELSATPLPTTQLRWRPHGAASKTQSVLVSVNAEFDGQIMQWHIKSGKCLHSITEKGNQIFCLDYFSDGSQFATAGKDRLLRVYDEATKRQLMTLQGGDMKETAGHSNRIFSLKYHPEDPNIILSGGWDNTVQVWDTRKGISVKSLWNAYICGDAVDISSDGRQILTGSWRTENSLQIWDFASGKVAQTIDWASASSKSPCQLFAAQFSKDAGSSMILAGGSQENEAKFFLRQPGAMPVPFGALVSMPKPVFTVDWSISSKMAAVGSSDGQVRVLEVL